MKDYTRRQRVTGGQTVNALYEDDVINNLSSTDTTKPLSANQGRVLNGSINSLWEYADEIQEGSISTFSLTITGQPTITNLISVYVRHSSTSSGTAEVYYVKKDGSSGTYSFPRSGMGSPSYETIPSGTGRGFLYLMSDGKCENFGKNQGGIIAATLTNEQKGNMFFSI